MRITNLIFNNFWPKLISLVLAVATWFYVFDFVNTDSFPQKKETMGDVLGKYDFTVKTLPVKPVFTGKSPNGYRVAYDKVLVKPDNLSVFGPEEVLSGLTELRTEKRDLGEYTRSAHLRLGIMSEVDYLKIPENAVDVFIPVEPLDKPSDSGK